MGELCYVYLCQLCFPGELGVVVQYELWAYSKLKIFQKLNSKVNNYIQTFRDASHATYRHLSCLLNIISAYNRRSQGPVLP